MGSVGAYPHRRSCYEFADWMSRATQAWSSALSGDRNTVTTT